jgi:hypothetical protein
MNRICSLLLVVAVLVPAEAAQRRKQTRPRVVNKKPPASAAKPSSPLAGKPVIVLTRNGDRIAGTVVDMNALSIRVKSDGLESALPLDTISSLSFGAGVTSSTNAPPSAPGGPDFERDVDAIITAFGTMTAAARPGADYTEYGRLLSELRPQAERFISHYSTSENSKESRAVALVAGALTDYSWARTIWTLKLGRSGDGTVAETDSPLIGDLLTLYPDLRSAAASGNRFAGDKLIGGLWKKAAEKVERIRPAR